MRIEFTGLIISSLLNIASQITELIKNTNSILSIALLFLSFLTKTICLKKISDRNKDYKKAMVVSFSGTICSLIFLSVSASSSYSVMVKDITMIADYISSIEIMKAGISRNEKGRKALNIFRISALTVLLIKLLPESNSDLNHTVFTVIVIIIVIASAISNDQYIKFLISMTKEKQFS